MKRSKTIQRTQRRQDKASDRKKYKEDTGRDKASRYATKRRGERHD
jgi:hypothetical protein